MVYKYGRKTSLISLLRAREQALMASHPRGGLQSPHMEKNWKELQYRLQKEDLVAFWRPSKDSQAQFFSCGILYSVNNVSVCCLLRQTKKGD